MRLYSFGQRAKETPPGTAVIIDCAGLANPHSVLNLRKLDGRDEEVRTWLLSQDTKMVDTLVSRGIGLLVAGYDVAFRCLGGRHRSVALAEIAAARWRSSPVANTEVEVVHLT